MSVAVPAGREVALRTATAAALTAARPWAPEVAGFEDLAATTRIVAADGRPLATLQHEDRRPLRLGEVPRPVRRAVLAAEDENFYRHAGVDPVAVARAAWRTFRGGRQGGSTITQQLAKTNFTTGARTLERKFNEALIAAELERRHTKDELFERYLNQVYFGERAYGLAAAARTYFGVEPAELSVAQAALLAGKIRAPDRLDPRTDPAGVLRRRNAVLDNMVEQGWLSAAEHTAARLEPLALAPPSKLDPVTLAPHFVELVKREAQTLDVLGPDPGTRLQRLATRGYQVETTFDPDLFEATEAAVRDQLGRPGDPLAATASVEPGTGAIRSLFGGLDFDSNQYDEASLGARQPGSAFKPFVYLAAIREGIDPRSTFSGASGRRISCYGDKRVDNANRRSAGRVDMDRALVASVNVVFVEVGCEVGVDKVLDVARRAGIPEGATEAQGAVFLGGLDRGVSSLSMAAAYATFASGGIYARPYAIERIVDRAGEVVYRHEPQRRRAFETAEVGMLNRALLRVVTSGTGRGAAIDRPVAGKTGTSQDNGDAWFVGYVPQLATAVWVGYEPRRPMRWVHGRAVFGGSYPAAIFARVMRAGLAGEPVGDIPTADPDDLDLKVLRRSSGYRSARRPRADTPVTEAVAPAGADPAGGEPAAGASPDRSDVTSTAPEARAGREDATGDRPAGGGPPQDGAGPAPAEPAPSQPEPPPEREAERRPPPRDGGGSPLPLPAPGG
jgi:penicillin-binding protein 1A